jgi:hypothetical protein
MVWVNTETHVYHKEGSRFYCTTKKGKYMAEAEAIKGSINSAKNRLWLRYFVPHRPMFRRW